MDAFFFTTKNGITKQYGGEGGYPHSCNTDGAKNPMIIGVGMQDHIDSQWWDCMQAMWCHYVDLDDF